MSESSQCATMDASVARSQPQDGPSYRFGKLSILEYLRYWAQCEPARAAYIFYGTQLSYAELNELSDRFAQWLGDQGIAAGDRIAVMLPTCPQVAIAFYGILKLGAVYVPINPLLKPPEAREILRDIGARGLLVQDALAQAMRDIELPIRLTTSLADMIPVSPTLPVSGKLNLESTRTDGFADFLREIRTHPRRDTPTAVQADTLACIIYSGGTTGLPKGCMHTHQGLLYAGGCAAQFGWDLEPGAVIVLFAPTFWVAGQLVGLISTVFAGSTCVLLTRWHTEAVMAAIDRYKGTHIFMFVDSAEEILAHPQFDAHDLSSLRQTIVSSQLKQLNLDVRERWRNATGATMREAGWGLTETHTGDTTTLGCQTDDADLKEEPIFCGRAVPGTEIRIVNFETRAELRTGEVGEICVRSPSVMTGYWNNPGATAETLVDGWLHSGDIGKLDAAGSLHYLGRRKEMIKVRGMSVYPAEIERRLLAHPKVAMCGVVGRKDEHAGERPVAFVQAHPSVDHSDLSAELKSWCREWLADYKMPEVRIVDSLPLTDTNKIKRAELARLLATEEVRIKS